MSRHHLTDLHRQNVLVTGATGLLGPHLLEALEQEAYLDHNLVALVRDRVPTSYFWSTIHTNLKTVYGDITDLNLLKRAMAEYEITLVFHLAAQSVQEVALPHPQGTFETNVMGTTNVLEAARQLRAEGQDIRVIVAGSGKAYAPGPGRREPFTEDLPLGGTWAYHVSKACTDLIAHSYALSYGLPVAITRFANLFGPGDLNFQRIIPGTIASLLRGERPVVRSDGNSVGDYLFVKDAAAGMVSVAAELIGERPENPTAYNVSTGNHLSVVEVAQTVCDLLDTEGRLPLLVQGNPTRELPYRTLSSAKITRRLGFEAEYTFGEAVAETIGWYHAFFESGERRSLIGR